MGWLMPAISLFTGGSSLFGKGDDSGPSMDDFLNVGREAGRLADPWMDERGQYIQRLNELMSDPRAFERSPGYEHRVRAGRQALESSMAAQGLLGSGAMGVALQEYGQGQAADEYNRQFERLVELSGLRQSSPAAAAGALTSALGSFTSLAGAQGQQPSALASGIESIASGAQGLYDWWKGPAST